MDINKTIDNLKFTMNELKREHGENLKHEILVKNRTLKSAIDFLEKSMWIPVEEQLPEDGIHVIATVRHRRWISDYKSDIIPECEWVDHPEWYEVTGVYRDGENYIKLDDDMHDITTVVPIELQDEDLGNAIQEVIAWMPMPEPYKTGEGVEDELQ